jgi:hypothetical protein
MGMAASLCTGETARGVGMTGRMAVAASLTMIWLAWSGARAADFVVVEAEGLNLNPGQSVDGAKAMSLEDGQTVTLLSAGGQIVKLAGPYNGAPDSGMKRTDSTDMQQAMAALISERKARTSEVGIVRGKEVILPDPWVVDVTNPGTSCIEAGKPVVLWRSAPLNETSVIFTPKDQSWTMKGTWPASADRITLPATMPLRDQTDYVVALGERLEPVTVRLIPKTINNDVMRASYMIEVGCDNQVNALVAVWQKR